VGRPPHHSHSHVTFFDHLFVYDEYHELANFPKPGKCVFTSAFTPQPTATVMMMMRSLSGAAVAATACLAAVATAQQSCGRAPECRTVRPQLLAQHARAAFTLSVNAAQETCCSFVSRNSTRDDVAPHMPETRQRCPNSVSCCRSTTATTLHRMLVASARLASVSSERVATIHIHRDT
jgi:hypothetical protein